MTQSTKRPSAREPASPPGRRAAGYFVAAILIGAVVAGGIAVLAASDDGSNGEATAGAFGTHYDGLEQRRLQAGVSTMSDASAGGAHIHPRLSVYVRREQVQIPTNIGIDPSRPPTAMAGLHTHDSSGVIHVENAADPTLGQFFEIWGVPLSPTQLGPYKAKPSESVRAWVDDSPAGELGSLVMEDGQQIVVALGPREAAAPPSS